MKKICVFIDHTGGDKSKEYIFAKKLKKRLESIKEEFDVRIFNEVNINSDKWEKDTLKELKSSEIIIPILSANYLAFISKKIETEFDKVISSNDKFLFPFLLSPCSWSSYNWIVKSKLIPTDEIPFTEQLINEQDRIINDLVKSINNIIANHNKIDGISTRKEIKFNNNSIFISHDHDDADFAELLKLRLDKVGLSSWIDSERLKIGQDWREEIDIGIENSKAVIAIMTPDARKSEYVTYEWAFAWGKGKKIFPIMLKQTQLHPRLESLQYLDFTNRAVRPWNDLIDSIKSLI